MLSGKLSGALGSVGKQAEGVLAATGNTVLTGAASGKITDGLWNDNGMTKPSGATTRMSRE